MEWKQFGGDNYIVHCRTYHEHVTFRRSDTFRVLHVFIIIRKHASGAFPVPSWKRERKQELHVAAFIRRCSKNKIANYDSHLYHITSQTCENSSTLSFLVRYFASLGYGFFLRLTLFGTCSSSYSSKQVNDIPSHVKIRLTPKPSALVFICETSVQRPVTTLSTISSCIPCPIFKF